MIGAFHLPYKGMHEEITTNKSYSNYRAYHNEDKQSNLVKTELFNEKVTDSCLGKNKTEDNEQ